MGSLLQNVKNNLIIDDNIYTEMKKMHSKISTAKTFAVKCVFEMQIVEPFSVWRMLFYQYSA